MEKVKLPLSIDQQWTLLIDRDGIINKKIEQDYVKTWEEFEFNDGIFPILNTLTKAFGKTFIITNQQGVGKKLMTMDALNGIHTKMLESLRQHGIHIDGIYVCPHLASDKCQCRKPNIGLYEKIIKDYPDVVFSKSVMIGDAPSDMEFGRRIGAICIYINNTEQGTTKNLYNLKYKDISGLSEII